MSVPVCACVSASCQCVCDRKKFPLCGRATSFSNALDLEGAGVEFANRFPNCGGFPSLRPRKCGTKVHHLQPEKSTKTPDRAISPASEGRKGEDQGCESRCVVVEASSA
eukprot:1927158-Rhodomonas_salina.1